MRITCFTHSDSWSVVHAMEMKSFGRQPSLSSLEDQLPEDLRGTVTVLGTKVMAWALVLRLAMN